MVSQPKRHARLCELAGTLLISIGLLLLVGCGSVGELSDGGYPLPKASPAWSTTRAPLPPPPVQRPRDQAIYAMCVEAGQAARTLNRTGRAEDVAESVERIIELNEQTVEADAFSYLVFQLADAWHGYLQLRDEPDLTDQGAAFVAMLNKLIVQCGGG